MTSMLHRGRVLLSKVRHTARSRRGLLSGLLLALCALMSPRAQDLPPIRSASEVSYPPFSMVDAAGNAEGFSVDLFRAAAAAMGREADFRVADWASVKGWLETGEVEALPLVGRSPERMAMFDFTFPYKTLFGAIVVREDTKDIERSEDLRGRRVAVMRADNAEEYLRRDERGAEIMTTATFEDALRALADGRCDAVVIQRYVAMRLIRDMGLETLRIVPGPIEELRQDLCFAVPKGDYAMLALLNEGLAQVIADGTYRSLYAQWFTGLELPSGRRIVTGGDHNYPPYEFLDERGRPAGFAVDLIRAIARKMDLEVEIRLGPWAYAVGALERGEIDVIPSMFYSAERAQQFDFTLPHAVQHYVAAIRRGSIRPPQSFAALEGLSLVAQEGDLITEQLETHGLLAATRLVETQEDVLREVIEGRADCGLVMRVSALDLIKRNAWTALQLAAQPLHTAEYCIAVRKGDRALLAQLGDGLRMVKASGEYRRIHERWLGQLDEPPTFLWVLRRSLWIIGPLAGMLLLVMAWSASLRRLVRRRTRELEQSEAQFRALVEGAPEAIFVQTDQRFAYLNEAACRLFGARQPEELIGRPVLDRMHPNFRDLVRERMRRLNDEQGKVSMIEEVYLRLDGSEVPVEVAAVPLSYHGKHGALVFGRDISERRATLAEIQHLNRVLRAIRDVNQLIVREHDRKRLIRETCNILVDHRGYQSSLIVLTDAEDAIEDWAAAGAAGQNANMKARLDRGEMPPCCRCAPEDSEAHVVEDRTADCRECPVAQQCGETVSLCVRLQHGAERFGFMVMAMQSHLVVNEEERALVREIAGDLAFALHGIRETEARSQAESEKEKLTAQLAQAQKMEAVGRLAGGVAHDFNNTIMGIMGGVDACREMLATGHPMHEFLDEIMAGADRSAELTRQLLAFARRQTIAPKVLDLNTAISGMLKLLRRLLGEDIKLLWEPGPDAGSVCMDPSQIDQILANLCVNARDAIQGVGKLTIETAAVRIDQAYCERHAEAKPGEFAILVVSDSGAGMTQDVLDHIFEPFFTTKERGKGTGLGLATAYGIVRQNDGFINVYSEPGQGTTFRIYLPRVPAGQAPVEETREVTEPPTGTETLLLVEDDPTIRSITERMLRGLGYTVLSASGSREALRLVAKHEGPLHLLVTDVVMPEMSGRKLADTLLAVRPDLRCLYMSGYTANVIAHHGVLDKGIDFLQKPVALLELATKVRAILDRA